jgi:hypothetical protein
MPAQALEISQQVDIGEAVVSQEHHQATLWQQLCGLEQQTLVYLICTGFSISWTDEEGGRHRRSSG